MEQNGYQWCWHRLQKMQTVVCEARLRKGVCQALEPPVVMDRPTAEFFNCEGELIHCGEVNSKRQRIVGEAK